MTIFNSFLYVYQRVAHGQDTRVVPLFQLLPDPFVRQLHLAIAEGRGILKPSHERWTI